MVPEIRKPLPSLFFLSGFFPGTSMAVSTDELSFCARFYDPSRDRWLVNTRANPILQGPVVPRLHDHKIASFSESGNERVELPLTSQSLGNNVRRLSKRSGVVTCHDGDTSSEPGRGEEAVKEQSKQ
ncbi:hypothetical protein B0H66DRAFT_158182 [Apodospora peruviana]|uniref:Uncharacterized protein n=1 Tax=Apodospora peruviana TaxID=516989 RepID=A0AAE0IL78_9PEZI|nr:hypothetical protein B0H66DRAFT_158182 [Apodospora peruviana]